MTIYQHIESNKRKTVLIMFLFVAFIVFLVYIVGGSLESLIFALVFSLFSVMFSYFYADKLVLDISQAKEVSKKNYPKLYNIVENLCIGAGIPRPKIYVIEDNSINAFATGRDPKHAAVAFTTGALKRLEDEELEGVAAHEISHIKNYDTRLMVIVAILVGTVVLLVDWLWFRGDKEDQRSMSGILVFLSPLIASLIKFAISRNREYLADSSAALLTRYPEGLARALEKIAKDNEVLRVANSATAHLYISNPLKTVSGLFSTHPPIEERIKRLRSM